jgi:hypothetical protein
MKNMNIDEAFKKLIEMWATLPRQFKDKYAPYKSKYLNPNVGIGKKIMLEMLEKAGFRGSWSYTNNEKGGIL